MIIKNKSTKGHIYIATNEYIPNLLKIGMTSNLEVRIPSMSNSSSVPGKFKLEFSSPTDYMEHSEVYIHALLHDYRVDLSKEFFKISIPSAIKVIERVINIINENPNHLLENFPNTSKNWDVELAKKAVEVFKESRSLLKTAPAVGKLPLEVETFLNHIGVMDTQKSKRDSKYSMFPEDCYKDGIFQNIISGDIELKQRIETPRFSFDTENERELLGELKSLRIKLSRTNNIQAFKIYSNRVLNELVIKKPINKQDMLNIEGFFERQYEQFGEQIIDVIKRFS